MRGGYPERSGKKRCTAVFSSWSSGAFGPISISAADHLCLRSRLTWSTNPAEATHWSSAPPSVLLGACCYCFCYRASTSICLSGPARSTPTRGRFFFHHQLTSTPSRRGVASRPQIPEAYVRLSVSGMVMKITRHLARAAAGSRRDLLVSPARPKIFRREAHRWQPDRRSCPRSWRTFGRGLCVRPSWNALEEGVLDRSLV